MPSPARLSRAAPAGDDLQKPLEDLVMVRIVRLAEVISRLATRTIGAKVGLRNTDLRLMNILDRTQGVTINEIARRTHVDKAWVSRSLRELEKKGLVTRRNIRVNSRLCAVALSPKGRTMLEQVRPVAFTREARLLSGIVPQRFKADLDQLMCNAEALLGNDAP